MKVSNLDILCGVCRSGPIFQTFIYIIRRTLNENKERGVYHQ